MSSHEKISGADSTINTASMGHAAHRAPLQELERPLTVEDVTAMQKVLAEFTHKHSDRPNQYVFSWTNYYRMVSSPNPPIDSKADLSRSPIEEKDFEELILKPFNDWRQRLLAHETEALSAFPHDKITLERAIAFLKDRSAPENIEELYRLYRDNKELSDVSPFVFQDGVPGPEPGEYIPEGNFIHLYLHRYQLYQKEYAEEGLRIYINPLPGGIPTVVNRLARESIRQDFPLYLKYADLTIAPDSLQESSLLRTDKIVVFTSTEEAEAILDVLDHLVRDKPELFENRGGPLLSCSILPGISMMEDPSAKQLALDPKTSANSLRADCIEEAMQAAAPKLIYERRDTSLESGQTVWEIVNDQIRFEVDRINLPPGNPPMNSEHIIEDAWEASLIGERISGRSRSDRITRIVNTVVEKCIHKVFPEIDAKVLHGYLQKEIPEATKKYSIDPTNLARNATS